MRQVRIALLIVCSLIGAVGALPAGRAHAQGPATPEALQAAKELAGMLSNETLRQTATQVTNAVWPQIDQRLRASRPDIDSKVLDELRSEFERIQAENMLSVMADAPILYARHFSADELRQLTAFYRTPIGENALKVMPQLTAEVMTMIMPRMQQVQMQTMEAFTKVLRARGFNL